MARIFVVDDEAGVRSFLAKVPAPPDRRTTGIPVEHVVALVGDEVRDAALDGERIVEASHFDLSGTKDGGWSRAEVQKTRWLNLNHNHLLKNIFKGAATTVITQLQEEPLHQDYKRIIAAGTKPDLAKLTIARKIAAIALSMWKSKERYDSTKHRKQS